MRVAQEQETYEKERKQLIEAMRELPNAIKATLLDLRGAVQLVRETKILMIVGEWGDLTACKEGAFKIETVGRIRATSAHQCCSEYGKVFELIYGNLGLIMISNDLNNEESINTLSSYNNFSQTASRSIKPNVICNEEKKQIALLCHSLTNI